MLHHKCSLGPATRSARPRAGVVCLAASSPPAGMFSGKLVSPPKRGKVRADWAFRMPIHRHHVFHHHAYNAMRCRSQHFLHLDDFSKAELQVRSGNRTSRCGSRGIISCVMGWYFAHCKHHAEASLWLSPVMGKTWPRVFQGPFCELSMHAG